ncbi:histidine phosphatase family protein [Kaustia mangrovi]|uniref:Histidine phosphatase family protein n=1 Tax=Kaustia mangrovi TaxID=2593653 RepID=A0A7S8C866_9HYPH|nr:histidine phosphatase family protein [Kaustia mangrovi]QPC45086.1 histidine phosphatase family protein [Kaustia mangrovi]
MLRLLLLRHAKSSWDNPALDDRDRPLNGRGEKAAPLMGRYMRENGHAPRLALCSPAIRARQTLDLVVPQLDAAPPIHIDDRLYDFGDGTSPLAALRGEGGTASPILVVGHNPSLETLADALAGDGARAALKAMRRKFPTGALAVIDFDADDWADIAPGAGTLVSFTRPKDL